MQGILIKPSDDTKIWGGITNTLEDRKKIQNDVDSLGPWAENNRLKFSKDKGKVLHLKRKSQTHSYMMGDI